MKKFNNIQELHIAAANRAHSANLSCGGVFDANGARCSDLSKEMNVARSSLQFCGGAYAKFVVSPAASAIDAVYVANLGWAPTTVKEFSAYKNGEV